MIQIRAFSKSYDELRAVKRLSLDIPEGQIYGFVGPNGAGKTTTIRFLTTLLEPTAGTALVNGFDVVRQVRDVRRSIGYMPDSFGLYKGMRVREYLDFFGLAYKVPATRRRTLIDDVLTLVDLYEKREAPVDALSRGMRQRLGLARTLVHDPPVLVLDEPASGLDPRARIEMKELLKELRAMGKTILISSHILSELADCCNSVAIIERGELLAAGPIDELTRSLDEHRTIDIRMLERSEEAERWLAKAAHVQDLSRSDGHIRLDYGGGDADLATLLEGLAARGHRVVELSERETDLETLFLRVTKGKLQ